VSSKLWVFNPQGLEDIYLGIIEKRGGRGGRKSDNYWRKLKNIATPLARFDCLIVVAYPLSRPLRPPLPTSSEF